MGTAETKSGVVLVAGLLTAGDESRAAAVSRAEELWGPARRRSAVIDFTFSAYYEREMGPALKRQFVAFDAPFPPEALCECKVASNKLERQLSLSGRRTVNIDPGYLDLGTLVVASTKDAASRVYLGQGIYAQPMLHYEKGSFLPWPWTYPDYRTDAAIGFFNLVRAEYHARRRKERDSA